MNVALLNVRITVQKNEVVVGQHWQITKTHGQTGIPAMRL